METLKIFLDHLKDLSSLTLSFLNYHSLFDKVINDHLHTIYISLVRLLLKSDLRQVLLAQFQEHVLLSVQAISPFFNDLP